jgi:hypothetical protein
MLSQSFASQSRDCSRKFISIPQRSNRPLRLSRRRWLAWTVVFAHIALYTGVDAQSPLLLALDTAASDAAPIFFIISGLVITHLLIEKKQGYLRYITRRFLRIYPVYFICLTIGIGTSYLYFETFAAHPWGEIVLQPEFMAAEVANLLGSGFIRHLLAHYTLMQGGVLESHSQLVGIHLSRAGLESFTRMAVLYRRAVDCFRPA